MPTPYQLLLNNEYSYEFVTHQGIRYSVYFTESGNLFEKYPHIAKNIYWFDITVKKGNADLSTWDENIGATVFGIFEIFFQNINNVAIYFCDTQDKR